MGQPVSRIRICLLPEFISFNAIVISLRFIFLLQLHHEKKSFTLIWQHWRLRYRKVYICSLTGEIVMLRVQRAVEVLTVPPEIRVQVVKYSAKYDLYDSSIMNKFFLLIRKHHFELIS